jgi:hypothetical protein
VADETDDIRCPKCGTVSHGCSDSDCPEAPAPADLAAEIDELHALNAKLGDLLTRSVNAVRGDPPPLTLWSWHDLPERIQAAMAALQGATELAAAATREPPAPAVPEGWKLVPIEPTPNMAAAGFAVSEAEHDPAGVYRAMLVAAPHPSAQPAEAAPASDQA